MGPLPLFTTEELAAALDSRAAPLAYAGVPIADPSLPVQLATVIPVVGFGPTLFPARAALILLPVATAPTRTEVSTATAATAAAISKDDQIAAPVEEANHHQTAAEEMQEMLQQTDQVQKDFDGENSGRGSRDAAACKACTGRYQHPWHMAISGVHRPHGWRRHVR